MAGEDWIWSIIGRTGFVGTLSSVERYADRDLC